MKKIDVAELAKILDCTEEQCRSKVFWIVDYLMDRISDKAIDAGAYHNLPANGDGNMVKSYQAILWAQYEEIDGQIPQSPGPWVSIDPINGIKIHPERPVYSWVPETLDGQK